MSPEIGTGPCHHGTSLSFINWWSGSSSISTASWKILQILQFCLYGMGLCFFRSPYSLTSMLPVWCSSRKKTHLPVALVFISIHPEKSSLLKVSQISKSWIKRENSLATLGPLFKSSICMYEALKRGRLFFPGVAKYMWCLVIHFNFGLIRSQVPVGLLIISF